MRGPAFGFVISFTAIVLAPSALVPIAAAGQQKDFGPVVLEPGTAEPASIVIYNECRDVKNFTVTASGPGANMISYTGGSPSSFPVNGLQSAKFAFTLHSRSTDKPGTYPLSLKVDCPDCRLAVPPCFKKGGDFALSLVVPGDTVPRQGGGGGRPTPAGGVKPPVPVPVAGNPPANPAGTKPGATGCITEQCNPPGKATATANPPNANNANPRTTNPTTPGNQPTAPPSRANPGSGIPAATPGAGTTNPNNEPVAATTPDHPAADTAPPPGSVTANNSTSDVVPTSPSSGIPLVGWILGALTLAGGVAVLVTGNGNATPAADGGTTTPDIPGETPTPSANTPDVVPEGWSAGLELPNQGSATATIPDPSQTVPKVSTPKTSTPGTPAGQSSDTSPVNPESWRAGLELPNQDALQSVIPDGSATVPPTPGISVGQSSENAAMDAEAWAASLELGAQELMMSSAPRLGKPGGILAPPKPGPGAVKPSDHATVYVDPDSGVIRRMVKVQPLVDEAYPGSNRGLTSPVYPPGKEPRIIVNRDTGEQKWIRAFKKPPDGWVEPDGVRIGSAPDEYIDSGSGLVRKGIPSNWVKVLPMPERYVTKGTGEVTWVDSGDDPPAGSVLSPIFPGSYAPGMEPRVYVDPNSGKPRMIDSGEKVPPGWVLLPFAMQSFMRLPAAPQPQKGQPAAAANQPQAQPAAPKTDSAPHSFSGATDEQIAEASRPPTPEETAAAHAQASGTPDPNSAIYWPARQPPASGRVITAGQESTTPDTPAAPPRPLTDEDLARLAFIDRMIADSYAKWVAAHEATQAKIDSLTKVHQATLDEINNPQLVQDEIKKLKQAEWAAAGRTKSWIKIKSEYRNLSKAFIQDIDELRQLEYLLEQAIANHDGPSLVDLAVRVLGKINENLPTKTIGEAMLGLSDRDLDTYGLTASLKRAMEEHQFIIELYHARGSHAVDVYLDNEAKMSLYGAVPGMVSGGAMGGVGATAGSMGLPPPPSLIQLILEGKDAIEDALAAPKPPGAQEKPGGAVAPAPEAEPPAKPGSSEKPAGTPSAEAGPPAGEPEPGDAPPPRKTLTQALREADQAVQAHADAEEAQQAAALAKEPGRAEAVKAVCDAGEHVNAVAEGEFNCTSCTEAGIDALLGKPPWYALPDETAASVPRTVLEKKYNGKYLDITKAQLDGLLKDAGPGATGAVSIEWRDTAGRHSFCAVNKDGHVIYVDYQKIPPGEFTGWARVSDIKFLPVN